MFGFLIFVALLHLHYKSLNKLQIVFNFPFFPFYVLQISYGEVEQKKALEKQLKSIKEELLQYQKKLKESEDHRRELADEITGSYDEV